jgi:hypothetical protein
MQKSTRIFKICGREYPYCKTAADMGVFHWRDVACSPEHAAQYFREIAVSRSGAGTEHEVEKSEPTDVVGLTEDDGGDEWFTDDFDDEEEEEEIDLARNV